MVVTGEYGEMGYAVYRNGVEVYRAGNSPYDSQQTVDISDGLPVLELRTFCRNTMDEIADENGDLIGDCVRV